MFKMHVSSNLFDIQDNYIFMLLNIGKYKRVCFAWNEI